jgi:hypothetical protein
MLHRYYLQQYFVLDFEMSIDSEVFLVFLQHFLQYVWAPETQVDCLAFGVVTVFR